jgi:hypothetical protein
MSQPIQESLQASVNMVIKKIQETVMADINALNEYYKKNPAMQSPISNAMTMQHFYITTHPDSGKSEETSECMISWGEKLWGESFAMQQPDESNASPTRKTSRKNKDAKPQARKISNKDKESMPEQTKKTAKSEEKNTGNNRYNKIYDNLKKLQM